MTVPNAGDFEIFSYGPNEIELLCPACGERVAADTFFSIRHLINAASNHANTFHAMSEQPATTGA